MAIGTFTKQPAEILDFDIDYSEFFDALGGDTISGMPTAAVTAASSGVVADLTLGPGSLPEVDLVSNQIAKVWVGAGISGATYKVTVTMTSAGGRVKEADVTVRVREQ